VLQLAQAAPKTMSSKAVHKPIALRDERRGEKNEIFVDVIDRISATFNSSGQVRTFSIDGSIQMKSYLSGSPELHLALNDDLVIASAGKAGYGMVELDNVNFHECVQLDKFESERMLVLEPPHGEFVLMNFHIGSLRSEAQIPFRLTPIMSAVSDYKQELRLQVEAAFPDKFHGANVKVQFTVPKSSTGASVELEAGAKGQSSEYDDGTKTVTWLIRKFVGGTSHTLACKFITGAGSNPRKEMGPISMQFEIPMYNVSRLQVQHLKIIERNKAYNPHRWVRCLTHADSYVCRI
jgi:AP-4 complex subunit mu-1